MSDRALTRLGIRVVAVHQTNIPSFAVTRGRCRRTVLRLKFSGILELRTTSDNPTSEPNSNDIPTELSLVCIKVAAEGS